MRHGNVLLGVVLAATLASTAAACSHRTNTDEEAKEMTEPESHSSQDGSANAPDYAQLIDRLGKISSELQPGGSAPDWVEGAVVGVELLYGEVSDPSYENVLLSLNQDAADDPAQADFVIEKLVIDDLDGKAPSEKDIDNLLQTVAATGGQDAERRSELSAALADFIAANPGMSVSSFHGEGTRRRLAGIVLGDGSGGPALLIQRRLTAAISHTR